MSETLTNTNQKVYTDVFFNPFPGLRPFGLEESHLFFGREGQSDEVLRKLEKNRFVAVLGASGSGKSSLMYCGLVPVLYGGFITEAGSRWNIIPTRPGTAPIENLAEALIESEFKGDSLTKEDKKVRSTVVSTILRSSSQGLVEAVKEVKREKEENILIIVDQFEELFRFKKSSDDSSAINEASAFVKLLLESAKQSEIPIYLVFTMRSDFIGDCAQFPNLTKIINDSHYLIPRMTREDFKDAIVGPTAVGGGEISSALVQQLLNDIGDNQDQLPILQHAMMRTWDYWVNHREANEPMDIHHYESIGKLEKALSLHANESFEELSDRKKQISQTVFKALTEKGADNRGIRRPASVTELANISRVTVEEVIEVVDTFRKEGRSFLAPSGSKPIHKDTIVDISHESLMRIWDRLKSWVEEEATSVQMYQRLCEASEMYQLGKTSLWRPPDLQIALNWRDKQNPTLTWAKRYNPAFERAIVFLETSEKAHEAEEENKLRLQKRQLRRTRAFAIILGVFAILMLLASLYSVMLSTQAEKDRAAAVESRNEAEKQKNEAEKQKREAQIQTKIANDKTEEAEREKQNALIAKNKAEESERIANEQKKIAQNSLQEAERQKQIALNEKNKATEALDLAEKAKEDAEKAKDEADKARKNADTLRMLTIAKAMAFRSPTIRKDTAAKTLVALGAWQAYNKFGGQKHNNEIYTSLYDAVRSNEGDDFNKFIGHKSSVRSITFSDNGNMFSSGGDGKIFKWSDAAVGRKPILIDSLIGSSFREITTTQDGKKLISVTDGVTSKIKVYDINAKSTLVDVEGHRRGNFGVRVWNNAIYSVGGDSLIKKTNIEDGTQEDVIQLTSSIKCIDIHNGLALVGLKSGRVTLVDLSKGQVNNEVFSSDSEIWSVDISEDGRYYAAGDKKGHVKVWDVNENKLHTEFYAQNARINAIKFSPDNKLLASASWAGFGTKGNVLLWMIDKPNTQPIELKDHEDWVRSLDFSPDGENLVVACNNGLIRSYPLSLETLAENLCAHINRNLSKNEWEQFVDEKIPYVRICKNFNKGEGIEREVDSWQTEYPDEENQ